MKKIGLIGGLGPEPTIEYYKIINDHFKGSDEVRPRIIIYSLDVDELRRYFESKDMDSVLRVLREGLTALDAAGASFGLIAANTPHIVFDELIEGSPLKLISIVGETLKVIKELGLGKVGLLGTSFTMQSDLFQKELNPEGIEVYVPGTEDQEYIQEKIYRELSVGNFIDETREGLLEIIKKLIDSHGIEAVILGCTELPLILDREEFGIPFLNTTRIHAESAIRMYLE